MDRLTQTERAIFDELAATGSDVDETSLTELASRCHVAKSTVVKTVQKLGFKGYGDYVTTRRLDLSVRRGHLLPRQVVEGDVDEAVERLATCFQTCEGRKSIAFSLGSYPASFLASSLTRKLNMFDVFAVSSYDNIMFDGRRFEPGYVFLFLHEGVSDRAAGTTSKQSFSHLFGLAHKTGYRIAVFLDSSLEDAHENYDTLADEVFLIASDRNTNLDFYTVRVLMLIEMALESYSTRVDWSGE